MSRITENQAFPEGGDDPLDEVVATCLESGSDELDDAVARACREHPGSADEIRRRIERLRKLGLLRPPGADEDERFPEQLGEFRLLERLGGGGMGVVFRARQEALARDVALKLIRPEHLYFPRARERFRRETEAAARLQHPGLVPIHTVGEANGIPFFAMELVSGATLAEALRELRAQIPEQLRGEDLARALQHCTPSFSTWNEEVARATFAGTYVDNVVRLVVQVADALQHAHSRGVLHRDVKPSNIAVTHDARALLFDFGLASLNDSAERLTLSRAEIGSLAYMSPEQLVGAHDEVDPRSDLYSLGVSLYELLALSLPFSEAASLDTRRAILEGRCEPLRSRNRAVSRDLEIVCAKAMERDKARRYADAAALARDLRNVLEHRPIDARPTSAALQIRRWVRRHPIGTTVLAAALAIPSALYVQQSAHARELGTALDEAQRQRTKAELEARDAFEVNEFLRNLFSAVDPSQAQGREVTARDLLDEGAHRLETELLDQPLVRARLLNTIGESYSSLGELDRAERTLARALELMETQAAGESLYMVESLRALAMLEQQLGRPGALDHARRAADMHRAFASSPTFELADTLVCYGLTLEDAGRLDEAEKTYREALAVVEQLPPPQLSARASIYGSLASVQLGRGEHEAALVSGREAVRLQRELGPEPHPAVTSALNTIALSLTSLERYDEARPVYDELLDEERRLTGEESVRYAGFLVSKSNVEALTGHLDEAILLLERASPVLLRLAPQNELALRCQEKLGAAYQLAARWNDAREAFRGLVPEIDAVSGASSRRALVNHVQIAQCDEALADFAAAEQELSNALARAAEARASDDDGWEAAACAHLARLLARRGDVVGAAELVKRAHELRDDPAMKTGTGAWTRLAEGIVADAEGDSARAQVALEELAKLERGPQFGEAAPAIARARLARVIAASEPTRGRELGTSARVELMRVLGADHPETRALVEWLDLSR